jgi:hypothetical protein
MLLSVIRIAHLTDSSALHWGLFVCRYLTPASAIYRLLTSPGRIGRFFDATGAPVYAAEHDRILGKGAKATARQQALARARTSSLGVAYSLSLALSFVVLSLDTHASAFTGR